MSKKYYSYDVGEKRFQLSEPSPYFGWLEWGPRPAETKEEAIKNAREHLERELHFHEERVKSIKRQIKSIPASSEGISTLLIEPAVETIVP